MTTTANQVSTDGATITLSDGITIKLVYNFGALRAIENEFGSINAFMELMNKGDKGPMIGTLGVALWAGSKRKMPVEEFLDKLVPSKTPEYVEAFKKAFEESTSNPGESEAAAAA